VGEGGPYLQDEGWQSVVEAGRDRGRLNMHDDCAVGTHLDGPRAGLLRRPDCPGDVGLGQYGGTPGHGYSLSTLYSLSAAESQHKLHCKKARSTA
jgi:hypothetical protein